MDAKGGNIIRILKERIDKRARYVQIKRLMQKGGIMMCKLKGWMDKNGHYNVQINGWMEKVAL